MVVIVGACGGSSDDNSGDGAATSAAPAEATEAPTTDAPTTAAPATAAPTTAAPTTAPPTTAAPVIGVIQESFVGTPTAPYAGVEIADGEIRVYFNNGSHGTLIAIYHGAGTADPTDLCPGNSINAGGVFQNISNAPLTPGACDGIQTDRGAVRICSGGVWLYETHIPNDSEGILSGSVDKVVDGAIVGVTGQATNQPGTPVIDWAADSYVVSTMFTNDGSTEIFCGAAMS